MPIRVVLGEDSLLVREGVKQLLDIDPEIEVVAAVGDLDSLRDACERERPAVRRHRHPDAADEHG